MTDKTIKGIKYSLDAKKQTAIVIARNLWRMFGSHDAAYR